MARNKSDAAPGAEKTYTYTGPLTGATLDDGREVMLHPGRDISLPPGDPYAAALVAMGRLKEKQSKPAAKTEGSNVG